MKLCIKKPKQQAAWGTVGTKMGIRNNSGENVCFARKNPHPSSIQTVTVGFGFTPNPAVTLAGLRFLYHRRLGITPDPEGLIYRWSIL